MGASAKKCVTGEGKGTHFFALAPIFARLKNEKCLERAENLTETLATQARFMRTIVYAFKMQICKKFLYPC